MIEFHPLADLFPLLEGVEFDAFAADIAANGILDEIVIHQGKILDGRNRYRAGIEAGLIAADLDLARVAWPDEFREFGSEGSELIWNDGVENIADPLKWVLSKNLHRRHLNESQRAMVAEKLAELDHGQRQTGKFADVTTQGQAAELLHVSERSLRSARQVREHGAPVLVDAVEAGTVAVSAAAELAKLPADEQAEIIRGADPKAFARVAKERRHERAAEKTAQRSEDNARRQGGNVPLPAGKYGVIYADPPWRFEVWSDGGKDRSAENHYPTMTFDQIAALPVDDLAAPDCALFLWAVMPQLAEALTLIEAWGFTYKTCGFNWVKTNGDGSPAMGMGYWTRSNAEICLLATRGQPKRLAADVRQVVLAPRGAHSAKPDRIAADIERLVAGPYVELFRRGEARPGWDAWGNEFQASAEEVAPNLIPVLRAPLDNG
jgi:N6-adenosine-specific RNA methylase IME4